MNNNRLLLHALDLLKWLMDVGGDSIAMAELRPDKWTHVR
jgi:hypothetical protein